MKTESITIYVIETQDGEEVAVFNELPDAQLLNQLADDNGQISIYSAECRVTDSYLVFQVDAAT